MNLNISTTNTRKLINILEERGDNVELKNALKNQLDRAIIINKKEQRQNIECRTDKNLRDDLTKCVELLVTPDVSVNLVVYEILDAYTTKNANHNRVTKAVHIGIDYYVRGLKYDEIGKKYAINPQTAKERLKVFNRLVKVCTARAQGDC